MVKLFEGIIVIVVLIFAFFAGVKYSDDIKQQVGWLFETKEEAEELPNLSLEEIRNVDSDIDEGVNYNK